MATGGGHACTPVWRSVPSPQIAGSIESIAAVSANDIWAVGSIGIDMDKILIEHWDGRKWRVAKAPTPSPGSDLRDVAAFAADDVWAVGLSEAKSTKYQGLIEHWDGKRWKLVPTPAPGGSLWGVSGDAPDDIWAVGSYGALGDMDLVLHWNGNAWRRVPPPSAATSATHGRFISFGSLTGVAAISRSDVWVAGDYPGDPFHQPFTARWDGRAWHVVDAPRVDDGVGSLAALSADDIWAVSGSSGGSAVLHWNGEKWRAYRGLPIEGPASDVAAASPRDVWLVDPPMHWNGRTWAIQQRPDPHSFLVTIAAVTSTDVWAAGWFKPPAFRPHFEHYSCS